MPLSREELSDKLAHKKKVKVKKKAASRKEPPSRVQDAHERQKPTSPKPSRDAHERARTRRSPAKQDAHDRQPRKTPYRSVQADAATRTLAQIIRERNMRSRSVRDPEFTRAPQVIHGRPRFGSRGNTLAAGFPLGLSPGWAEQQLRDLGSVAKGLGIAGYKYGRAIGHDIASPIIGDPETNVVDLLEEEVRALPGTAKMLISPEAWREHTALNALLALPIAGTGARIGSRAALTRSIRDASRPRPQGTPGATFEGRARLARYPEKGEPGFSFLETKGGKDAVFRDASGEAKGFARVTDEGSLQVWVDPELRRQGIATRLYDTLERNGVRIDEVSGRGLMTPEGAALAASRQRPTLSRREAFRIAGRESRLPGYAALHGYEGGLPPRVLRGRHGTGPGRMQSFHPLGRAGQRAYDYASTLVEGYFGPGAPFATSRRAARAEQKLSAKRINREEALVTRAESTIRRATMRRGRRQEHVEEALVAALEAPRGMSPRQAVETKLRHLSTLEPTPGNQTKIALLQKALEGQMLEGRRFTNALDAQVALSQMASRYAAHQGVEPEILASRQNRVAEAWAEAGLLPEGVEPVARGFFPHRGEFESIPGTSQPVGYAAAGNVIGRPKVPRALERRRNELLLYGSGKVSSDPKVLSNTVRGRIKFGATLERRQWLYDNAQPLIEGADFSQGQWSFIRNPEALPATIPDAVKAALRDPDNFYSDGLQTWKNEWLRPARDIDSPEALLEWAGDLENVRIIPTQVAKALIDDVFTSAPRGRLAAVVGTLNQLVRNTVLYLPDGGVRYVARNAPQNMILLALTRPRSYARVVRDLKKLDRELWDAIKVETGAIRAAAGLPERLRGETRPQRLERGFNNWSRRFANRLGDIADEPFRVAAWMEYARKYGMDDVDDWRRLLTDDDPAVVRVRDQISQKVREDLIDFDALTPVERETISRFAFIYAFKRGAAKWPLMYLREYPEKAAILALVGLQHDREGIPGMPESVRESGKIGGIDIGLFLPWDPLAEDVQAGVAQARLLSEGRLNLEPTAEYLGPLWQEVGESLFGGGPTYDKFADVLVPGKRNIERLQRGGTWDEILKRELGVIIETPEFRKKERAEQRQRVEEAWGLVGDRYDQNEIATAFNAHEAYKDLRARAEFAAKDLGRKLTEAEKALLMTEVAREYRPDLDLPDNEAIKSAKGHKRYIEALEEALWGAKTKMLSAATRERNKQVESSP